MVAVEGKLSPRILGGNGIAAGTVNYPCAAAHAGSCRSGFRGVEHSDFLGSTPIPLNIYYDANWQAIETRTNGTAASDVTSQMVWSAAYINAAILQDTYSAGVIQPNSRIYFLQDANWDTTAVVGYNSTAGTWGVTQRYVYSPYGSITVLNADWSTPPAGTQPLVNNLYQGMTLDAVTGLYYERFRNYSPTLGTWISQDPASYVNGADAYQFEVSQPATSADPTGEVQWSVLLDGVEHLAFGAVMFGLSYGAVASGVGVAAFPGLFVLGGYEGVTGLVQIAAAFGPAQIASDASKLPGMPGDIVALNAKALGASDTQSKVIGDTVDFGATGGFGSAGEDIAKTATGYLLAKTVIEAKDYKTWTGNAIASVGAILPKVTSTATPNMVARLEIKGVARVTLKSRPRFVGHIVTKGENLWAIWHHAGGNSTGVTWSQMKQANSFLKNPAALQPGWGVLAPSPCDRGGRLTTILVDLSGAEKC